MDDIAEFLNKWGNE
ncbi:hypothetical protein V7P28_03515 [Klebsiella michiganensis]